MVNQAEENYPDCPDEWHLEDDDNVDFDDIEIGESSQCPTCKIILMHVSEGVWTMFSDKAFATFKVSDTHAD